MDWRGVFFGMARHVLNCHVCIRRGATRFEMASWGMAQHFCVGTSARLVCCPVFLPQICDCCVHVRPCPVCLGACACVHVPACMCLRVCACAHVPSCVSACVCLRACAFVPVPCVCVSQGTRRVANAEARERRVPVGSRFASSMKQSQSPAHGWLKTDDSRVSKMRNAFPNDFL